MTFDACFSNKDFKIKGNVNFKFCPLDLFLQILFTKDLKLYSFEQDILTQGGVLIIHLS